VSFCFIAAQGIFGDGNVVNNGHDLNLKYVENLKVDADRKKGVGWVGKTNTKITHIFSKHLGM
jgi:hypothetical protein